MSLLSNRYRSEISAFFKGVMGQVGARRIWKEQLKPHWFRGSSGNSWLGQCLQCCSPVMHRMSSYISKPYLGACCYEPYTYTKVWGLLWFRHQRFQFHSIMGSVESPSLYWKVHEFLPWFSERNHVAMEVSSALCGMFIFLRTRRLLCRYGGSHLEVKKKSPLKEQVRNTG